MLFSGKIFTTSRGEDVTYFTATWTNELTLPRRSDTLEADIGLVGPADEDGVVVHMAANRAVDAVILLTVRFAATDELRLFLCVCEVQLLRRT